MGFTFNGVEEAINYKELLIPAMNYEVEITGIKESKSKSGNDMLVVDMEVIDTIPSGQEIDTEEFRDPLGAKLKAWVVYGDFKPGSFMYKNIKNFHESFGVDITSEISAEDFENTIGGVRVVYEPVDKADPSGPKRTTVKGFVMPN